MGAESQLINTKDLSGVEHLQGVFGVLTNENGEIVFVKSKVVDVDDIATSQFHLRDNETGFLRVEDALEIGNHASSEGKDFLVFARADFSGLEVAVVCINVRVDYSGLTGGVLAEIILKTYCALLYGFITDNVGLMQNRLKINSIVL